MALTKSQYVAGRRCHRLLWLQAREPHAPELVPDVATQLLLDHGAEVGEAARERFAEGVLATPTPWDRAAWKARTAEVLEASTRPVFEAVFEAAGGFAAVDVLEPDGEGGWRIVEVKGSLDVKPEHVEDVAFQAHVLRAAGMKVSGVQVMHLNRACEGSDLSALFVRADVKAEQIAEQVGPRLRELAAVVQGDDPKTPPGRQCKEPTVCPFRARCEIPRPDHHISELYADRTGLVKRLEGKGVSSLAEIPEGEKLSDIQARQVRAVRSGARIVEPGLVAALSRYDGKRVAFLDFESIAPAIPAWAGCHPLEHIPVQFSVHTLHPDGRVTHHEHLAEPMKDPRPPLARALVEATRDADVVFAYYAAFEKGRLEHLVANVPECADALRGVVGRLEDLLPVVRNHVYDPAFHGQFSLKKVAPVLVNMSYEGMTVGEGMTAAAVLERMVLGTGPADPETRRNLLDYCGQDTEALVALFRRLHDLALEPTRSMSAPAPGVVAEGPRKVLFCERSEEALGYLKATGEAMESVCLNGNSLTLEAVERAIASVRRDAGKRDVEVLVVGAFANSREGARRGSDLAALAGQVAGVRYERAAPARAGESWARHSGLEVVGPGKAPGVSL